VLSCTDNRSDDEELLALLQASQLEVKAASEALQENTGGSSSRALAAEAICKTSPTPADQPNMRQEQEQQQGQNTHTLPAETVCDMLHLASGKFLPGCMEIYSGTSSYLPE
jgi:hypothetical protein